MEIILTQTWKHFGISHISEISLTPGLFLSCSVVQKYKKKKKIVYSSILLVEISTWNSTDSNLPSGFELCPSRWKDGEGNGIPLQHSCLENPMDEEPGGLQSMGSHRVGHDWATSLSLFTFLHWRRKWQPTPVFLPGESQGQGSLVGCCLWGHTESDTTDVT